MPRCMVTERVTYPRFVLFGQINRNQYRYIVQGYGPLVNTFALRGDGWKMAGSLISLYFSSIAGGGWGEVMGMKLETEILTSWSDMCMCQEGVARCVEGR